jgi:transposase
MSTATDYKTLYEQSQVRIIALEQQLLQLQKMIFGSKQERFVPADPSHPQLTLELNTAPVAASTIVNTQQITYKRQTVVTTPEPLVHPGRMKLPESLRREAFLIEPAEDTTGSKKIGEEITEVLEYKPGELYVKQYRRIKYAKPNNEGN